MAPIKSATTLLMSLLTTTFALQYQLIQNYNASNIFDEFDFFNGSDPTGGFVQFVPFDVAAATQLIGNTSNLIYLGVDSSNPYLLGGPGRPSIRLESKATFTEGLFVIDLTHIPVGCGTWPALWTAGLSDWPADGEIDIIENVNNARTNNAAIHAAGECSVLDTVNQTGTWKSTNCNIVHDDDQGCGTVFTEPANYGAEFNANGGGIYAMEWTSSSIRIWFFPSSSVPVSLLNGATPDSSLFGTPSASFEGPCSSSFGEKFFNHSIVIDTTFCGGWAGGTFGTGSSSCFAKKGLNPSDSCVDYVANNPEAFKDAYWGIRSIKVWEKVQGYTVPGLAIPGFAFPTPATTPTQVSTVPSFGAEDAVLKPIATLGSLNVSSLTGGVLSVDYDDTNADSSNEKEYTEEDHSSLDGSAIVSATPDSIDYVNIIHGYSAPPELLKTGLSATPPTELIPKMSRPAISKPSFAGFSGSDNILSASFIKPSTDIPFKYGDTEIQKNILPPKLSLPLPKGKQYGNTGVVPPERLQSPVVSEATSTEIPNTLPLELPNTGDKIDDLDTKLGALTTPEEMGVTVLQPPQGDHILPVSSNLGIVPPSISNSPVSLLWGSFKPELKGQLIAAAMKLPNLPSGSNPLSELWESLTLEQKNEIQESARNLPPASPESSTSTISDLINAAPNGKIPGISGLQVAPLIKITGNGLLGLLDAKTKATLKAAVGKATKIPPTSNDVKRQVVSVMEPVVVGNIQAGPALLSNTLPDPPFQPANPVFALTPNVSVAALTNADTVQAMTGLLSFLDNSTKAQIAGLLLADDAPTADVSQEFQAAAGELRRRGRRPTLADKTWNTQNQYQTWNQVKSYLLDDTIIKLDGIIKYVAGLDGPGPSQVTSNSILDVANPEAVEALAAAIDSISIDDRYRLAEFLTGNKDIFNQIGPLISLLLYNDGTTPATGLQDIMNAVNNYAASPNDDTLEVFMETLQDSTSALYNDISSNSQTTKRGGSLRAREATSIWTPQDKLALAQNVYALCPSAALIGIPFPSPYGLALDLLDPSITLENATTTFQRKLQAYFDVTVQGCWTKINQWLAWRQLLRKPGTATILPFPALKTVRNAVRQDDNDGYSTSKTDAQGFLEQQIYTICPNPDTFSTTELVADLKDEAITIDVAISKFQNRLWAYMAKLQSCSDKIRSYGPQLKAFVASSEDPVYHTTDDSVGKRHIRRQLPDLDGLSPVEILTLLDELKETGQSYADLSPETQKGIYDAMVKAFSQGQDVDPSTLDQLQNLALGLAQATVPLPPSLTGVGGGSDTGSQDPTTSSGPVPSDNDPLPPADDNDEDNQGDDNGGDDQDDDNGGDDQDDDNSGDDQDDGNGGDDQNDDNGGDDQGDDQEDGDSGDNQGDDNSGDDQGDDTSGDDQGDDTSGNDQGDDQDDGSTGDDQDDGSTGDDQDDGSTGDDQGDGSTGDDQGDDQGNDNDEDQGDANEGDGEVDDDGGDDNDGTEEGNGDSDTIGDGGDQQDNGSQNGDDSPDADEDGSGEPGDDDEGTTEPGNDDAGTTEPGDDDETSDPETGLGGNGDNQDAPEGESGDSGDNSGEESNAGPGDNGDSENESDSGDVGDSSGVDSGDEPVDSSGEDATTEGGDSDPAADSSVGSPDSSTGDGVDENSGSSDDTGGSDAGDATEVPSNDDGTDEEVNGGEVPNNDSPNSPFGSSVLGTPDQGTALTEDTGEQTYEPGFFSRIVRSISHRTRQVTPEDNGVIPDADVPADLDKILGPHGTLDPYGFLGPQIGSSEDIADTAGPHDSPNVADDQEYDLPDSAVDEASPEVDQILKEGGLDPFGQTKHNANVEADEDLADKLDSETYLKKLKEHEREGGDKYDGNPKDVEDFMDKFLGDRLS